MTDLHDLAVIEDFGAVLADPPWHWKSWSAKGEGRSAVQHYDVMDLTAIKGLPVGGICKPSAVLFLWATWPMIDQALDVIDAWGFTYKTCAFAWIKTSKSAGKPVLGNGYWTRSNSEVCLLATRGKPRRLNADVGQVIIEPRREHSRKPSCTHDRIERLVGGPYVELFARSRRPGWTSWGDETDKHQEASR